MLYLKVERGSLMADNTEGAAVFSEDGKRWGTVVNGEVQWHDGPPPTREQQRAEFDAMLASIAPMTTDGSAEVPAEQYEWERTQRMLARWNQFPASITNRFEVYGSGYDAGADDECTRLEARLSEVEAERDDLIAIVRIMDDDLRAGELLTREQVEAERDALRAAVRPLVEAATTLEARDFDHTAECAVSNGKRTRYGCTCGYEKARAALADPAIAALLDQQKEQG